MSFKFGTNQSPGSTDRLIISWYRTDSGIPGASENEIDLIFGTTADKSYHDLVIQNGKTSPIMNSTSSQSIGSGSCHMVANIGGNFMK